MATAIEDLQGAVTNMENVVDSAVLAFRTIAEEMMKNANDATAIRELADDLNSKAQALGEAIPANTPADPNA